MCAVVISEVCADDACSRRPDCAVAVPSVFSETAARSTTRLQSVFSVTGRCV